LPVFCFGCGAAGAGCGFFSGVLLVGAAGCGFGGCFMFILFLLVGKRFSSHVPIYAFSKKRKAFFEKIFNILTINYLTSSPAS
jgi:hypothetical protein